MSRSNGKTIAFYMGQICGFGTLFLWLLIVLNITLYPPGRFSNNNRVVYETAGKELHGELPASPSATHNHQISVANGRLTSAKLGLPELPPSRGLSNNEPKPAVISQKKPVVQEASIQTKGPYELQWPPVRSDGSIDPQDGVDVMPLTGLKVPRFWAPAPGEKVTQIGSRIGGKETIFLMIASYRDFQCRETIAKAFLRADNPERLFIGAVDQIASGDISCLSLEVPCKQNPEQPACKYRDQISVYEMDAAMATGPVTARHIGDRLYRGQYFVMQMDAHCHFASHWDTDIIGQWRETGNEMAVLSSYLTDIKGSLDNQFHSTRNTRPIMCNSDFEGAMPARYLRHGSQPEDFPTVHDMPQLQPFWAAGFSFSRGHFTVTVPYDGYEPMVFQVCTYAKRGTLSDDAQFCDIL